MKQANMVDLKNIFKFYFIDGIRLKQQQHKQEQNTA